MNNSVKILTFVALVAKGATSQAAINTQENQPNIILIVADDHGIDALGCYGNKTIKTPNIDLLAKEGVRFNNAYCTSASSAASRSVILTGQFGHAIGAYGHVHDYHHFSTYDNVRSLPVILSENGYATTRIGKYHVAPEKVYHFDTTLKADPRNTVAMADSCKDVFKSDKPFFLYFCTDDPHRSNFTEIIDGKTPNPFGNKKEGYPGVETVKYDPKDVVVPSFLTDNQETREEIAQYYQSISRIDQGVGRLMKYLTESGKTENTIVIYMSDNGMAFPGAKTTVYEPGIRLPFIIKNPFIDAKDRVCNARVSWVDLTPTILDMANVDASKESFHGHSFKNIINQENPEGWNQIQASHTFHEITMYYPMRVFIDGDYKLIWNIAWPLEYPFASDLWVSSTWQSIYNQKNSHLGKRSTKNFLHRPEFELYDIKTDPDEINNLAYKKAYKTVVEKLKSQLKEWQYSTKDPWMIMWNHDASMQGKGEKL